MPSTHSLAALRRVPTPLLIVGGLHLAVIWAFLNGLQIHGLSAPTATVAEVIDDVPTRPEKPLPPAAEPREMKFTLPEIPVEISQPTEPQLTVKADHTTVPIIH